MTLPFIAVLASAEPALNRFNINLRPAPGLADRVAYGGPTVPEVPDEPKTLLDFAKFQTSKNSNVIFNEKANKAEIARALKDTEGQIKILDGMVSEQNPKWLLKYERLKNTIDGLRSEMPVVKSYDKATDLERAIIDQNIFSLENEITAISPKIMPTREILVDQQKLLENQYKRLTQAENPENGRWPGFFGNNEGLRGQPPRDEGGDGWPGFYGKDGALRGQTSPGGGAGDGSRGKVMDDTHTTFKPGSSQD